MPPESKTATPIPRVHILGSELYTILRQSPTLKAGTTIVPLNGTGESFRDFLPTKVFSLGVDREDKSAEIWLAAYIGYYIGNCLSYLNDVLLREEIGGETHYVNTKLLVRWDRVAATLGCLAGFQVLFVLAALTYCRRSFEIVDGVSTYSSMFLDFPFGSEEEKLQGGTVPQGKFIAEGNEFRWVFAGKDIEMGVGQGIK